MPPGMASQLIIKPGIHCLLAHRDSMAAPSKRPSISCSRKSLMKSSLWLRNGRVRVWTCWREMPKYQTDQRIRMKGPANLTSWDMDVEVIMMGLAMRFGLLL